MRRALAAGAAKLPSVEKDTKLVTPVLYCGATMLYSEISRVEAEKPVKSVTLTTFASPPCASNGDGATHTVAMGYRPKPWSEA